MRATVIRDTAGQYSGYSGCDYGWGTDIDPKIKKERGIVGWSHQREANGLERRDNWLYGVLSNIPKLLEKYKRLFNYDR